MPDSSLQPLLGPAIVIACVAYLAGIIFVVRLLKPNQEPDLGFRLFCYAVCVFWLIAIIAEFVGMATTKSDNSKS